MFPVEKVATFSLLRNQQSMKCIFGNAALMVVLANLYFLLLYHVHAFLLDRLLSHGSKTQAEMLHPE